ncbi:MAG: hypothetical protein M3Y53_12675 [Thermoproteota archaeon]|nr:hypothetical protein [Thermoproteota archaeon]
MKIQKALRVRGDQPAELKYGKVLFIVGYKKQIVGAVVMDKLTGRSFTLFIEA